MVRQDEHDITIGKVAGANMFNLLAVVTGIASVISPITKLYDEIISCDRLVMISLTIALLFMAYGFRRAGRINKLEGAGLLIAFCACNIWLVSASTSYSENSFKWV